MESNTNAGGKKWYQTEVGAAILTKKYMHPEETTVGECLDRVARIFSNPSDIREALENADFFPAGRSMYGAGSKGKFKATMSNCYILPSPEDNLESIFGVNGLSARIYSYGGGCGLCLDNLRPKGAKVHNAAKTSSGPVSYMDVYNATAGVIGANNRRAALLMGMSCHHPDIAEFIEAKANNEALQSANLSVLWTDEFMNRVDSSYGWDCEFKVGDTGESVWHTVDVKGLFNKFCEVNFDYAEPGAIFIDRVREHNYLSGFKNYKIDISNPCAEYFGNAYNNCTLGSINLYNCVRNPFTKDAAIDWDKVKELVKLGVTALDEILDYGYDMQPLPENKQCVKDWRAIGLGVFGYADMLVSLGIKYGSPKALIVTAMLFKTIQEEAVLTSVALAKEKGSFEKFDIKAYQQSEMFKALPEWIQSQIVKHGIRNAQLLSIAPTGTISTMCGLSGGIEPLFRLSYERTTHAMEKTGQTFRVEAMSVKGLLDATNCEMYSKTEIQSRFPELVDSEDILPADRIATQAQIQEFVDNAISSTVNLPFTATVNDIRDLYKLAWSSGCKGVTVYRDGCKRTSILKSENANPEPKEFHFDHIMPVKRRDLGLTSKEGLSGAFFQGSTACVRNLYTGVNQHNGNIFEIFTNTSQGCTANIATITRLASLALRSGIRVREIIDVLKESNCAACLAIKKDGKDVANSCGASIGEALEQFYQQLHPNTQPTKLEVCEKYGRECPECGSKAIQPEGKCYTCRDCGWSKCE